MKKTLALLLALAGVAAAVEAPETIDGKKFNQDLAYYLEHDAYTGGNFTITFTIKEAAGFGGQTSFITLGDSYYIHSQSGTYIGLTTTLDGDAGAAPATELVDGVNKVTRDMSAEGATVVKGWISKDKNGNLTDPGVSNSTYTITVNGADTIIEMSFDTTTTAKQGKEMITLQNYTLDLNKIAITLDKSADESGARITQISNATVTYNGKEHNLMVPEPATATLSLLALAGLAARRRRH